jgi:hypothetical protein
VVSLVKVYEGIIMKFWRKWKSPSGFTWDLIIAFTAIVLSEVHGYEFGILLCAIFGLFSWRLQIRVNRTLDAIERTKKVCLEYQEVLESMFYNFSGLVMPKKDAEKKEVMLAKLNTQYSSMLCELKFINKFIRKAISPKKIERIYKKIYSSSFHIIDRTKQGFPISGLDTNLCIKMLKEIETIVGLLNEESAKLIS